MFGIGGSEFIIIALVALFIFGPDRLPGVAKQAARLLRDVRRWTTKARADLTDTLGPEFENFDLADLNPKRFVQKHLLEGLDDLDEDILPVPRGATAARSASAADSASGAAGAVDPRPSAPTLTAGRVDTLALTESTASGAVSADAGAVTAATSADAELAVRSSRPHVDFDAT